ncbi:MAG: peptidase domain-containing ABC transporter [Sphingomonadaceae bacterium]|nr:peptidase domain-containing ABC transporter [Sphingomonadaceae bacterium]
MTAPMLDLIAAYARRRSVPLGPDWAFNLPKDVSLLGGNALGDLCDALGWEAARFKGKPRAHQLPALVFDADLGWAIAESWINNTHIRLASSSGPAELKWSKELSFWEIIFPGQTRINETKQAVDVFWSAILRRKSMIIDATVATVVINLIALVTSIYSMQVYDRVIPRAGFDTLLVLTGGMVFALIVDMLIRNTRSMMIDREAGAIDGEVSEYFYARMQAVRLDARPRSVGTMAAQLRGTEQVRSLLSSASLFVLADLPFALLFMAVMAWLGGIVALVPLLAFPAALVLAGLMARFIKGDTAAAQVSGNRKNGQLVEALDAAETIKANLGGWHMLARWNRLVDEVHLHDLKVKRWSAFSGSGFSLIQQLAYVGVVCLGAFEVAKGNMTMGGVIACSILSGRVNGPLVASLPTLIVQWGYARSSLAALDAVLAMPSDQPDDRQMVRQSNILGQLSLENVKFAHQGSRQGMSLPAVKIAPGERIGIIGPVGSGKSTLLKLMAGLYAPQEGHVLLNGVDVRQIAEDDLRRQVCYFPQDYRLITGTLRDNVTLGLPVPNDETLLEAASKTGLAEVIRNHPLGLDLPISEGGNGLSGGQRVQVGLTRLLLAQPKLLLLDEPTANLDQESEARVLQAILQSIGPDCTLIFVTHKMQLVGLVQRLIVVSNGTIAMDGPTQAVLEKLKPTPSQAQASRKIQVVQEAGVV